MIQTLSDYSSSERVIHLCFSIDDEYAQHLTVALASIFAHHSKKELFVHIIEDRLSEQTRHLLSQWLTQRKVHFEFLVFPSSVFQEKHFVENTRFPSTVFNRFKIPDQLQNIGRVLYLDADIVVLTSLRYLYESDLQGHCLGLVEEFLCREGARRLGLKKYFNSGVILFDVQLCKEKRIYDLLVRTAISETRDWILPDQDILNVACQDHIFTLPFIYNAQLQPAYTANLKTIRKLLPRIVILHYTGNRKPWKGKRIPYRNFYYKYLLETPWKAKLFFIVLHDILSLIFCRVRKDDYKIIKVLNFSIFRKCKKI